MPFVNKEKSMKIVYVDYALCDNCGDKIEKVFDEPYIDQFKDALVLTLKGGYGCYKDCNDYSRVLCHKCADELLRQFPCLEEE